MTKEPQRMIQRGHSRRMGRPIELGLKVHPKVKSELWQKIQNGLKSKPGQWARLRWTKLGLRVEQGRLGDHGLSVLLGVQAELRAEIGQTSKLGMIGMLTQWKMLRLWGYFWL